MRPHQKETQPREMIWPIRRFGHAFSRPMAAGRLAIWSLVILAAGISSCSEPPPPPVESVRAIRTVTVAEPASGRLRRFSGVVEAADTAGIGFEVPGNVREVMVDLGEPIVKGQVLAVMDQRTFALKVEAAQADVGRAQVELREAKTDVDRYQRMSPGAVSQRTRDQAQARYDSARKNLSLNVSRLNLAKRDLEKTTLRSPFDGIIADRLVDPFQQVAVGEKLFDLQMEGAMEVVINVPESEIDAIALGLAGQIHFPSMTGTSHRGIITEISQVVATANAFRVKLTLEGEDPRIRSGITAEVTLLLGDQQGEAAFLIPLEALSPGGNESEGTVFVYDPASSTVRKTTVEIGGIRTNNIVVVAGLEAGDIVAAAGVSFLRDGQTVRLQKR